MEYGKRNTNAIVWREVKVFLRAFAVLMWVWAFLIFRNDSLRFKAKDLEKQLKHIGYETDTLPPNHFLALYTAINGDMVVAYQKGNSFNYMPKKDEAAFIQTNHGYTLLPPNNEGYIYKPYIIPPTEDADERIQVPGISFERNPKNPYKFAAQVSRPADFLQAVYFDVCNVGKGFYKSEAEFRESVKNPEYFDLVFNTLSTYDKNFLGSKTADELLKMFSPTEGIASMNSSFLLALFNYAKALDVLPQKTNYESFVNRLTDKGYAKSMYASLSKKDIDFEAYFSFEEFTASLLENNAAEGSLNYLQRNGSSRKGFTDSIPAFLYVPFEQFKTLLLQPDYKDKLYLAFKYRYNLSRRNEFEYNMAAGSRYEAITLKETARLAEKKVLIKNNIIKARESSWSRGKISSFLLWAYPLIVLGFYGYRPVQNYIRRNKKKPQAHPFMDDV